MIHKYESQEEFFFLQNPLTNLYQNHVFKKRIRDFKSHAEPSSEFQSNWYRYIPTW